MNIYGKAMTDTKRQALAKVVELVLRKPVKSEENVGQTKPKASIRSKWEFVVRPKIRVTD